MAVLAGLEHLRGVAERLQWDAEAIDLSADRARLDRLQPSRRARIEALLAGFWVAEHGVAEHLAPFCEAAGASAAHDLLDRQAADERRHARFFHRVLREVLRPGSAPAPPEIERLFERELPEMASALAAGAVELSQAVALYHLILEAIVLSTGQDALLAEASEAGLAGVARGVARVQADERWHIGLGVQLLRDAPISWSGRLEALAQSAIGAWGPGIATPERVAHALATHRRRLTLLVGDVSA